MLWMLSWRMPKKQSADIFLFAGDYCLSMPFPEQAVQRIACMDNAFVIRGNEEQYIERMQGEDEGRWGRRPDAYFLLVRTGSQ